MNVFVQLALMNLQSGSYLFRTAVIAFAITFVLAPPQKGCKGLILYLVRFLAVTAVMLLFTFLFSLLLIVRQAPMYWFIHSDTIRHVLAAVLCAVFLCRWPAREKYAMMGSILGAVFVCVNLSFSLGRLVDNQVQGFTVPLLVLIYGLLAGFAVFENHFSLWKLGGLPKSGAILLNTTNLLVILMTVITQILDTSVLIFNIYSVIVYLVLFMMAFACYLSLCYICKEQSEADKIRMENQMMRVGAEQIALSRSNLADLRKIRHDLKNAYTYMRVLLDEGKTEELGKILDSFSPQKITPESYVDCGNSDISAILTAECSKALDKGMKLDLTLAVPPTLPFESGELFSLLTNLIDNAIDANERYGFRDDIRVQISLREEYLYICVTNRIPPEEDREALLRLHTRKADPTEHGLGTQIVKRLSEKYNGYFLTDIDGDRFVAEVLLDMMYDKEARDG